MTLAALLAHRFGLLYLLRPCLKSSCACSKASQTGLTAAAQERKKLDFDLQITAYASYSEEDHPKAVPSNACTMLVSMHYLLKGLLADRQEGLF